MKHSFHREKTKILVAGMTPIIRNTIVDIFHRLGFKRVSSVNNLKYAVDTLETEVIDWLIADVSFKEEVNGFRLMNLIRASPELAHLKVSFMVSEFDLKFMGKLLELGAMSFHRLINSKNETQNEMSSLLSKLDHCNGDFCCVSSHYVRKFCLKSKHYKDFLAFTLKLVHSDVGEPNTLLLLAEANFLNKKTADGAAILKQIELIAPHLEKKIIEIRKKYIPEGGVENQKNKFNALGIETIAILDPNATELLQMKSILESVMNRTVHGFRDSRSLLNWIKSNNQPELIIIEWSLRCVPAPIVIQRIRSLVGDEVPIVSVNHKISDADKPFLQEMGVLRHCQKPIQPDLLLSTIIWTIRESIDSTSPLTILRKIDQEYDKSNWLQVGALIKRYNAHPDVNEGDKITLVADIAYREERYLDASSLCEKALKYPTDTLRVLTILGNCYMKLHKFESALICLENCKIISPYNIGRLCSIAETHMELNHETEYQKNLAAAKIINPNSDEVLQLEAKVALVKRHTDKAMELMEKLSSLKKVISYINNRAIVSIQCGKFEEGIRLYHEGLASLPKTKKELRSIICRNMGLAFARNEQLVDAKAALKLALDCKDQKRIESIENLLIRIDKAIESEKKLGLPKLALKTQKEPKESIDQLDQAITYSKSLCKSDRCCGNIFIDTESDPPKAKSINKPLFFKKRLPLKQDYSLFLNKRPT